MRQFRKVLNTLDLIQVYRNAFRNWYGVIFSRFIGKESVKIIPRGLEKKILTFHVSKNGVSDGMLLQNFTPSYWSFIAGKCDVIIDIGASIGDSSILFAVKGAKKIIALEPNQFSYKIALENIEINALRDNITLLNAGYGEDGFLSIRPEIGNPNNRLLPDDKGVKISILSLNSLIRGYLNEIHRSGSADIRLKVSCAGCESYLINENDEILSLFSKIQIKFDEGYYNLFRKFENLGYSINILFLDFPKRGWLLIQRNNRVEPDSKQFSEGTIIPLNEFFIKYKKLFIDYKIPLVQTPEFNFSFNQSESLTPVVAVTKMKNEGIVFSIITFNELDVKGITIIEANVRGGPVIIGDDELEAKRFSHESVKLHFKSILEYLKSSRIDLLTFEPMDTWKDELDPIFADLKFTVHEHCDFFLNLPDSTDVLFNSFKRLAKRKINMSLKSGVVIEEIKKNDLGSHIDNFGKIWTEMYARSGKAYNPQIIKKQIQRLSLSNIATIFGAKLDDEFIAYRVVLIDKNLGTIMDFSAPSNKKAYDMGANYLLVYHSMQYAISKRIGKWFFWGVVCNPIPGTKNDGIYKFKQSFISVPENSKIVANLYRKPISLSGKLYLRLLDW